MKRTLSRLGVATAASVAATIALAAPAVAGPGGNETGGGYGAHVSVHVTGDVSSAKVASVPGPPPVCWWENLDTIMLDSDKVDTSDPAAVQKYYHDNRPTGHAALGQLAVPDADYFNHIIDLVKSGKKMTFYHLTTRTGYMDGKPGSAENVKKAHAVAQACGTTTTDSQYGPVLMSWQAFPTGNPPPPAVDPETLADYAYEVMDLVKPTLEWNPKSKLNANASVVKVPTWVWTRDHAAVEEREVTASAGGISATVTAGTDGMTVSSPVTGTSCSAAQAGTPYSPGTPASASCQLLFPRGSGGYAAGFPVQSNTAWHASWTSNIGDGGDLAAKTVTANTDIPVVELQTTVTGTD